MYGEETLNHHAILKYSLTKEFFESFCSLVYLNMELPSVLIRPFHVYIQSHVMKNRKNRKYITLLRRKHSLKTVKDAQKTLTRNPKVIRNLSNVKHRNMILLPGRMAPFAIKQLSKHNLLFMIASNNDRQMLQIIRANGMQVFDFRDKLKNEVVPQKIFASLRKRVDLILKRKSLDPIFRSGTFKKWLLKNIRVAIKTIKVLEVLVRKYPIKVIIDHVEIVNPGTALSLLSKKFNLPFINIPQVLVSDRSLIPTRASHYCVWGEHYEMWLQRRGIPSSRITKTGNVNFENENQEVYLTKRKFRKKLSIPSHHKIITFTTQPFVNQVNQQIINWMKQGFHSSLPTTCIIRSHPSDKLDYQTHFANSKNIIVAPPDLNLYDVLINSDVIMTISSNTGIEAALHGKAILVLQPSIPYHYEHHNNDFNSHLAKAMAGPVAFDLLTFSQAMNQIAQNPKYLDKITNQSQQYIKKTIHMGHSPSDLVHHAIRTCLALK